MIEYGMTDSTSYGAVFGKGDTKVDINDGGELSGDNYYGGLYFKHRTAEGIDVLGSFGIVKSDFILNLKIVLKFQKLVGRRTCRWNSRF